MGIPFFINSPKEAVRLCIGNPKIAAAIARYPVVPRDHVRYVLTLFYIKFCVGITIISIAEKYSMLDGGMMTPVSFPQWSQQHWEACSLMILST